MDHPSGAAMRAFWQITELSDAIERRLAARGWQPLQYTGPTSTATADQLSKKGRDYILRTARCRICAVLEGIEEEERLSSHARLLLRACLGSAKHFVGLVFHHFCEHSVVERLVECKYNAAEDIWSGFVKHAKDNSHELRDRLTDLGNVRHELNNMRVQLRQAYRTAHFHVHRVSYPTHAADYASLSLGKRVVIDPPDPAKFVSDNFHIMDSAEAFVVEPLQHKHLEIHVFVTDDCPEDAGGVERLMRMDFMVDHWDIFDEKWLSLIVIYNLPSVPAINTWLAKAREALLKNVQTRTFVKRSSDKEDSIVKGVYPSRMVGLGDVANQSGGVGPFLNFPKGPQPETSAKYEIMAEADFVLDGMITISDVLMPTLVHKWRTDGAKYEVVPSGLREATFSGFASKDYAEKSHFDMRDNGATMGLRCSDGVLGRPFSYSFVQPNVWCDGRLGIIVAQVFGTLLFWCASETEHTSTADPVEFYNTVVAPLRIPSVGAVIAQQLKLLSVGKNKSLEMERAVYWPAFNLT